MNCTDRAYRPEEMALPRGQNWGITTSRRTRIVDAANRAAYIRSTSKDCLAWNGLFAIPITSVWRPILSLRTSEHDEAEQAPCCLLAARPRHPVTASPVCVFFLFFPHTGEQRQMC